MAEEGSLLDRAGKTFPAEVVKTLTALPPHDLDQAVRLLADPKRRLTLGAAASHTCSRSTWDCI
ncbi:hypothetical protein ACWDFL_37860 [Streptomyces bungoensis]